MKVNIGSGDASLEAMVVVGSSILGLGALFLPIREDVEAIEIEEIEIEEIEIKSLPIPKEVYLLPMPKKMLNMKKWSVTKVSSEYKREMSNAMYTGAGEIIESENWMTGNDETRFFEKSSYFKTKRRE